MNSIFNIPYDDLMDKNIEEIGGLDSNMKKLGILVKNFMLKYEYKILGFDEKYKIDFERYKDGKPKRAEIFIKSGITGIIFKETKWDLLFRIEGAMHEEILHTIFSIHKIPDIVEFYLAFKRIISEESKEVKDVLVKNKEYVKILNEL